MLFVSVKLTRSLRVLSDSAANNRSDGVLKEKKSELREYRSDAGQIMGETYQSD